MIDIVTVVFDDEIDVLRWQAQSINIYCQNLNLGSIKVLVNDQDSVAEKINPLWWNQFADHVEIIPRSKFECSPGPNGWVDQQILKLLGAASSSNLWSMVLDAKTVIVSPLDNIFDLQGRCRSGRLAIPEVFVPSKTIVDQLFNIELNQQIGPGGVPFFLHNETVQKMIQHVESTQSESFVTWFQNHGRLTEFILYSGFVKYLHGNFDQLYSVTNAVFPCNVCHSETSSFDRKVIEMKTASTVSVHRGAWVKLTAEQQNKYTDFLHSRGIQ